MTPSTVGVGVAAEGDAAPPAAFGVGVATVDVSAAPMLLARSSLGTVALVRASPVVGTIRAINATNATTANQNRDVPTLPLSHPDDPWPAARLARSAGDRGAQYTESPDQLSPSASEARQMLEAVRAAGVLHGYAETEVFSPAVVKACELIDRGNLAAYRSMETKRWEKVES